MSDDAKMWQDAHARAVAEIARLRSVCREAATTVRRVSYMTTDVYSAMLVQAAKKLADAGKEPSDGV